MAKSGTPIAAQEPKLSPAEMRTAINRFKRRIEDLEKFNPAKVQSRSDPAVDALEAAIGEALSEAYGHQTPAYGRYAAAASLDTAPFNLVYPTPLHEVVAGLQVGKDRSLTLLAQAVRSFEEKIVDVGGTPVEIPVAAAAASNEVFIIHGHDSSAKVELARLIERAGLTAIILHETPNSGQTIIEKFERHGASVGFAVALLTPDDVGGPKADSLKPRARQNVIGEMFWFAGRLGRKRICALKKGEIEMPTDFAGVAYTDMDDRGAWKSELLKELAAAGYTIDWAKALA